MSVRKRTRKTSKGETKSAWIADYLIEGQRHHKQFSCKRDAELFLASVKVDVKNGIHTPDRDSITVKEASLLWLQTCEYRNLERSTLDQYRQHCDYHINPILGDKKLVEITGPALRIFEDDLYNRDRSPSMIRKVRTSLGAILADAVDRGLCVRNIVRETRARRHTAEKRHKRRLEVGQDIPTPNEVKSFLQAATDHRRALLAFVCLTGVRASELRALRWTDITNSNVHIRQRADYRNEIGRPKTFTSERSIPLAPQLVKILNSWRMQCPPGDYVFGTTTGTVANYSNLRMRVLIPTWESIGILDRYRGWHCLRHFYASWCINRPPEGLGISLKELQYRMGHASITQTADTYSHLFPRDDSNELQAGAAALLGE